MERIRSRLNWGRAALAGFGVAAYAFTRGRRDFVSRSRVVPTRYELLVDPQHAERARTGLAGIR